LKIDPFRTVHPRGAGTGDSRDAAVGNLDVGAATVRKARVGENRCRHAGDFMEGDFMQ
jgi:hypothetical protein